MQAMVSVSNLTRKFGDFTAVDDLSFNVAPGEVVGFLGPNGAGKSTTMKMITGFLAATAGKIEVCGINIESDPKQVKQQIGYLPEGAPMYGDMTTQRFLGFIGQVRGFSGTELNSRIDASIERLQLEEVRHQTIETLSKGFKRRVGLAQAILHNPPVLVLDEPTDGLDPNQKHQVRQLITDIASDKAIIISTHILEEVDAVCSRALIIARGKLLADGTPTELMTRADDHNTIELVTSADQADALQQALAGLSGVASVNSTVSPNDPNSQLVRLRPHDGANLLGAVNALISERNLPVQQIHMQQGKMEQLFRQLTTTNTEVG